MFCCVYAMQCYDLLWLVMFLLYLRYVCYDCAMFRIACCYEKETFDKQGVPDGGK